MYFCSNCGAPYQDSQVPAVCKSCGKVLKTEPAATPVAPATPVVPAAPVAPAAPQYTQPAAPAAPYTPAAPVTPPTYAYAPATPPAPESSNKGALVMSIIGMALGIEGLVVAVLGFIYGLASFALFEFAVLTLYLGILALGSCIAARCLGNKAYFYGRRTGITSAARVTGLIGIILSAVSMGFAIIALASGSGYYY